MENNFEIKDTKDLQLCSLQEFAYQLGFWISHNERYFESRVFVDYNLNTDKNIISFKTMVSLHNDMNYDNHGRVYDHFGFDLYTWEKAKASKIVDRVSLIMNKKKKTIHCNKHWVRFCKPFYKEIFLDPLS